MYVLGQYFFDSKRLLFYKSNISEEQTNLINNFVTLDEKNSEILSQLSKRNNREIPLRKIAVNSMGICPTYNCNLRCNYCGYSSSDKDNNQLQLSDVRVFVKDIIRKSLVKKLITNSNEPLIVTLTGGGEPTFDWSLFENIVLYIKEQCANNNVPVKFALTTNGILDKKQIDFISDIFSRVMISYDGLPQIQDLNRRGPGIVKSSSIVEQSICELAKRGVPVEIRTTIWQTDCYKLKDMYHYIFSFIPQNCDITWSIYPTLAEGRALDRMNKQEDRSYKTFLKYYFELIEYVDNIEGEKHVIYCPLFADNVISYFCGSLFGDDPFLQPDGTIVLCNESKEFQVCIGSLKNGRVEYFDNYKNDFLEVTLEKYSECSDCIAYSFCKGGCPIWHLREKDSGKIPVECHATKEYWTHLFENVLNKNQYLGWELKKINVPGVSEDVYQLVKKE